MKSKSILKTCFLTVCVVSSFGGISVAGTVVFDVSRVLGIELDPSVLAQQNGLSTDFLTQFKTTGDLTEARVLAYFASHPFELIAFRAYAQQLHQRGYLQFERAEALVVAAFRGASRYDPLRAGLASSLQDRPTGQRSNPSPLASAVEDMLPQTSVLSSPTVGSRQLDFGEAEQRALDAQAQVDQERAIESLAASERRARNVALAAAMIDEFSKSDAPLESIETRVANAIARVVEEQGEEKANRLLNNVSVSITPKDGETEFDVRGLLAFDENGEKDTFVFGEMGYARADDQDAINVGVGIRALNPSGTAMVGINAFYDRELSLGHERASVGAEFVTSPIQLAANRYYALSGSQDVGSGQTETPLSGHDIDTKIALPYLNGLFAGYNQSVWYGETGPDIERNRYSISGNLSEHFSLEISRSEYSRVFEDTDRAKLSYNYIFGATNDTPTLFSLNSDAYSFEPIGDQMRYRMVPRENDIVTETADSGGLLVRFRML